VAAYRVLSQFGYSRPSMYRNVLMLFEVRCAANSVSTVLVTGTACHSQSEVLNPRLFAFTDTAHCLVSAAVRKIVIDFPVILSSAWGIKAEILIISSVQVDCASSPWPDSLQHSQIKICFPWASLRWRLQGRRPIIRRSFLRGSDPTDNIRIGFQGYGEGCSYCFAASALSTSNVVVELAGWRTELESLKTHLLPVGLSNKSLLPAPLMMACFPARCCH